MEINTERINRVVIPRRALAKRVGILWLFEIMACLCGFGLFGIVSVFCILEGVWLTMKFRPVWRLYYHPATLYILLGLLVIPAIPIGLGLRRLIQWLIFSLPRLIF
ncbi:MAG: hypothetical protein IJX72_06545 [Clostridia bacterium]|nr:hypothetical protein [Clostridia bacterium]